MCESVSTCQPTWLCVRIIVRLLVILKPMRVKPCCVCVCMCVSRRLVTAGGGKQGDLYSFDHPGGMGQVEHVSNKVRREFFCPFQQKKCELVPICGIPDLFTSNELSLTSASGTMPCMSALLM